MRGGGGKQLIMSATHYVFRVGILYQNAKSWFSGILGFEVRWNSKIFFFPKCFLNMALYQLVYIIPTAWVA
jgi:hypothetical protein